MAASTFQRIYALHKKMAQRYAKLSGASLIAATAGIDRYLDACQKLNVEPEITTIREVLDLANERKFGKRPKTTP